MVLHLSSQGRSRLLGRAQSWPLSPDHEALRQQPTTHSPSGCTGHLATGPAHGGYPPPPDETVEDPAFETKQSLSTKGIRLTWVIWLICALQPVHSKVSHHRAVPSERDRIYSVLTSALCSAGQRRLVQSICLVLRQ